jgi:outer membrane protein assembly factor BamB
VLSGLPTGIPALVRPDVRVQDVLVLPPSNDGPPEVLASTYDYTTQADTLTYLDMGTPAVRWTVPNIPAFQLYNMLYTHDDQTLYVASEARLLALKRVDGSLAWEAALSDKMYSGCAGCLQLAAGNVVALTDDGQLQAFDQATGRPAWDVRLEETPRQLFGLGDQVALVDEDGEARVLKVFDAKSGELARQIEPLGKNEPFPNDPQTLDLYTPALADPDGESLYFFIGFFPPVTIQRWNVVEDQQLWEAALNDDLVSLTASSVEPVLADGTLYFRNGHYEEKSGLIALDLEDGSVRSILASDPDYELDPLGAQDDVLLVAATRTRGTRRTEVWGLNNQTGDILWKHQPEAADLADEQFSLPSLTIWFEDGATATPSATASTAWIWRLASGRLILLEVLSNQIVVDSVSLANGASLGRFPLPLRLGDSFSSRVEVAHLTARQVWLDVDGSLQVFDLETGTMSASWP